MNLRRDWLVVLSLVGIALAFGLAGGVLGYRAGRQEMRNRADPEAWHARALRRFDEVVNPSPEQSRKVSAHLDLALEDLRRIRQEAVQRTTVVIDRLVTRVESELTPEQRAAFQQLKPGREDVTLEVLDVPP